MSLNCNKLGLLVLLTLFCVLGETRAHAAVSEVIGSSVGNNPTPVCAVLNLTNDANVTLTGTYERLTGFALNPVARRYYAVLRQNAGDTIQRVVTGRYAPLAVQDRELDFTSTGNAGVIIANQSNFEIFLNLFFFGGCGGSNCLFAARLAPPLTLLASSTVACCFVGSHEGITLDGTAVYVSTPAAVGTDTCIERIVQGSPSSGSIGCTASPIFGVNPHVALDLEDATILQGAQNTRVLRWDANTVPPTFEADAALSGLSGGLSGVEIDPNESADRFWAADPNTIGIGVVSTLAFGSTVTFGANEIRSFNGLQYDSVNNKLYDVAYDTVALNLIIRRLTPSTLAVEQTLTIAEANSILSVTNVAHLDVPRQLLLIGLSDSATAPNSSKVYEIGLCD